MSLFLVTGGCGFIGSHLCDALIAEGESVRVLDDLSTGKRENLPEGVELIEGSVADSALVRSALADIDGCFHLAAIASVERSQREWLTSHQTNLGGIVTLFDAMVARGSRAKMVYASSAAVYGEPSRLPLSEETPPRPLSAYGADKLGSELHASVATRVHGIPTTGLRFFNVYGPRQDPRSPYSGVVSLFAARLARGMPITIFGDGNQTRDFIYVADVIHALQAAMTHSFAAPRIFNVCTGTGVSVGELAEDMGRILGVHPRIAYSPARSGDIRHSLGSPERSQRELELSAPIPITDGLALFLDGEAEHLRHATAP